MKKGESTDIKMKTKFDQQAKDLQLLQRGQKVRIQDHISKKWDISGTIIDQQPNRISYTVLFPNGCQKVHKRQFLKPMHIDTPPSEDEESTNSDASAPTWRCSPRLLYKVTFA